MSQVRIVSVGMSGNTLVISRAWNTNFANLSVSAGYYPVDHSAASSFSNSNGVSFGLNGSTITASRLEGVVERYAGVSTLATLPDQQGQSQLEMLVFVGSGRSHCHKVQVQLGPLPPLYPWGLRPVV